VGYQEDGCGACEESFGGFTCPPGRRGERRVAPLVNVVRRTIHGGISSDLVVRDEGIIDTEGLLLAVRRMMKMRGNSSGGTITRMEGCIGVLIASTSFGEGCVRGVRGYIVVMKLRNDDDDDDADLLFDDDDEMYMGPVGFEDEVDDYIDNGEYMNFLFHHHADDWGGYHEESGQDAESHVDEEEEGWPVRGERDVEGETDVESSGGLIDDEERMRSGGLSGVGDVFSEEEEEAVRWARGRNLRVRSRLEGTSLDDRVGWGGDSSSDGDGDTDEEIRRSPSPRLRRSTRLTLATRTPTESDASDDDLVNHSPPRRRSSRLGWAARRVVEDDSEDEGDSSEDGPTVYVSWRRRPSPVEDEVGGDEMPHGAGLRRRRVRGESGNGTEYWRMRGGVLYRR
jgi:hypothetical protein